eukprot:s473_g29.t1
MAECHVKVGTCVPFYCWCSLCHIFVCDRSLEVTGHSHSVQAQRRSGKKQESVPIDGIYMEKSSPNEGSRLK